jgi:MFS family permease
MGLFATAVAIGGVVGPILSGVLVQHSGFRATFWSFAALAAFGAVVFSRLVPASREIPAPESLTAE